MKPYFFVNGPLNTIRISNRRTVNLDGPLVNKVRLKSEYHIRRAIELDPADARAYIYLGNILWRQFEYETAEEAFQTAISLWPESSIPYWCLAIFYDYEKRPKLAGRLYRQALEINPDDTVALLRYGRFLRSQHRSVKAKRIFQRLLSLEPDHEQANAGLYEATLESKLR